MAHQGLPPQDAAQLSASISGLARAQLPLPPGLRALGQELPPGRLRRALDALAQTLEGGASLDEAIAAQGERLPAHLTGLVQAGSRTGRTGEILGQFAEYSQIGTDVRRRLGLSLIYPFVALMFAFTLLLFVLTFIVGGFARIFADFGIPLPLLSVILIELSEALRTSGWSIVEGLALLGVIALAVLWFLRPAVRRSALSRLPLFGSVWRSTSIAEFCHLLGLLLECGLPLVEAVPLAGEGVVDSDLQSVARSLRHDLAGGESLGRAIARHGFFPLGLGPIVAWAEQHQSLAAVLHMIAEMFEARARTQASFASTVCSVLAVLVILTGIGLVVFGVLTPMIQLIQKLSG
jgi:type II secretory pathway component PulF